MRVQFGYILFKDINIKIMINSVVVKTHIDLAANVKVIRLSVLGRV